MGGICAKTHAKMAHLSSRTIILKFKNRHFQYSHYLDIVESNGVKIANSEQELSEFINRYLNDPALESAGRNLIVDNQCSYRDGKSSERLLRYIIDFTKEYSV